MTINYYNTNGLGYFSSTKDIDVSELYRAFLSELTPGAYILDAGCGSGRDSKYFIQKGFRVFPMDGSEELVRLASEYIGQPVHHMTFNEIDMVDEFDGIWACASLLHVPRAEMASIFAKFTQALKSGGLWYLSYKWGSQDRRVGDRLFTDYDHETFAKFLQNFPQLELANWWQTADLRGRDNDWLNAIVRKRV